MQPKFSKSCRYSASVLACLSALCASQTVSAKDIPVTISWSGTKPDLVSIQIPGGMSDFDYDARTQVFSSTLPIDDGQVEVRTLLVNYSGTNHPFYLKVNPFLPKIAFRLSMTPAKSCLKSHIDRVAKKVDNLPDAMRAVLQAGQLLAIDLPDDCGDLSGKAQEAKYKRTVQLAQYSNGLFQTGQKLRSEYLESVPKASRRRVAAEVAEYENEIDSLEAVQLAATRTEAQYQRDFDKAAAINDVLLQRAQSDEQLETLYKQQGLTINQLEKDGRYLDARAASIRQSNSSGP